MKTVNETIKNVILASFFSITIINQILPNEENDTVNNSEKTGYFENLGDRTGNIIKDPFLLAGGVLGLGRDKKDEPREKKNTKKSHYKKRSHSTKKEKSTKKYKKAKTEKI
ncbi:hypothetical protein HYV11_00255 [Candidatus Dependentiae bacterium]|nr:hypothetical protein [Candidatus Dependentiae bacterium]